MDCGSPHITCSRSSWPALALSPPLATPDMERHRPCLRPKQHPACPLLIAGPYLPLSHSPEGLYNCQRYSEFIPTSQPPCIPAANLRCPPLAAPHSRSDKAVADEAAAESAVIVAISRIEGTWRRAA